jgi:tetratricopeptide (TPR) repeat protein
MASEVIDLLGTTSEEEDENSDAGKLKLLRNIVGATPSIERLTSLIEQAGGDVQGAANLFFDIPSGPDADILQVIGTSDNVRPSVPISPALDPPGVASAQGQQSSSQKLQVGAVVTVSANCDARNLLDGCLAEHEHGTVSLLPCAATTCVTARSIERAPRFAISISHVRIDHSLNWLQVIEVVDDSEPYQVRNEHGVTWWYRTHDLMQADTPEQAREMPGSQVKREGQPKPPNKRPANIDDPDCVVADSRNAKRPATSVVLGEADDDVQISGADDPMILVAHARFNCRMLGMSFSSRFGQSDRSQNQKHCPQCYCYVCDVEAAKCTTWSTHCMADGSQVWQEKRQERKEAATGGSAGSNGAAATSIQPNPPGGLSFGRNPLAAGRAGSAPVRSRRGLRSPTGSYDLDNFVAALPSCVEPQQGNPPTGYRRAKLATGLPSHGQAGWPRLAGTVEFLMPRCIMHTHATIPDNTAISQYFCLEHSSALVLLNGKWQPQGELVSDLTTLQSSGQCHLKWEVHHADRDISDTVAKKLELLRKHRPFTFDLTRKWVPEITYRSATKIFEDRPAQAEGNMEWWNHVKELTCVKCPPPVSGVHHKGGRALHARPPCGCDTELRSALCKLENRGGNESHDPSNCCRFVCHVSFDKSITINTHAQGDSRQSFANSVRRIMKHLQLRGFPDPALQTPVPPLQVTDTPQALQKLAERELSQAKYEEAELAFTASLNVSLPHRLPGKSGSTARRECMIGRATARLELHDYSGAMHDLSIVLSKSNRVGEALHLYGRALMKQNKPKDAIGFLAKAIEVATKDPESKAIYEATMNEANAVLRAAAESEATIARVTLHVHNLYGSQATSAAASDSCSVNLWWAKPKTNCEQPRVVTVPGSRYVFQNHTHVTCLYQKEYDHLKASRMRTEIRAGRVSSSSCYNDSSHLRDDLGIVLVPQSSPPRVQNKTKDARVTNSTASALPCTLLTERRRHKSAF